MPHKDVPICLNMDLLEQRDEAMRALDSAARASKDDDRMVSRESAAVVEARARVNELDAQIRDASITLRVYGVDRHVYNQWFVDCPAPKGKTGAFDPSTFYLHAAKNSAVYVDKSGVEHDITPGQWGKLDKMTDGEHDRLAQAVLYVNRNAGSVDVSFFGNASEMTRDSFGTSASRETSESPRVASGAGKPRKSTSKTSTKKADAE
jgi:hypothetical protein